MFKGIIFYYRLESPSWNTTDLNASILHAMEKLYWRDKGSTPTVLQTAKRFQRHIEHQVHQKINKNSQHLPVTTLSESLTHS